MKPDSIQGGDAPAPQSQSNTHSNNAAAADLIRMQIDSLYESPSTSAPTNPANSQSANPYHRTHSARVSTEQDQWKQYHSAWQNYYQQYYAQYYQNHKPGAHSYFANQPTAEDSSKEALTKDEALVDLRSELLSKVKNSAKKARGSRHFMPIFASAVVVLIFVFLQYNRVFIASVHAYVSPGAISPQNIVIDPAADNKVSGEPRLIIPKINVDVPVVYDIGNDNDSQMKAMEKGVAHFAIPGANSRPGVNGNTVLSGHSSNDLFDGGDYKFIFAQLDRLKKGDTIYANYQGTRYTYVVTKTEVVKPNEVNKLVYKTDKPVMTLITCTPLGTALNRLLVTAEQVNPDPAKAAAAPNENDTANEAAIPGNSPTLLERLFGAR